MGESPVPNPGKGESTGLAAILGQGGIVAVVALVGTVITAALGFVGVQSQLEADRRNREMERAAAEVVRVDEQVDALYDHALTTLASGTPELRIVGIYELGGVIRAKEQSQRYDRLVREILAGNLRVFAPTSFNDAGTPIPPPLDSQAAIRAIVDVLGVQEPPFVCAEPSHSSPTPAPISESLPGTPSANLAGVNFRDQSLAITNFIGVDLRAADFTDADLSFAKFCDADLTNVNFTNATLVGTDFTGADVSSDTVFRHARLDEPALRSLDLETASLAGADLTEIQLPEFDLRSADMRGAILTLANLSGADLDGANLSRAVLVGTSFAPIPEVITNTRLSNVDLQGADLRGADLRSVEFHNVDLYDADLSGANLRQAGLFHADLGKAELACADLTGVVYDDRNELTEIDFTDAVLDGANLAGNDLSETNLTPEQFYTAFVSSETIPPPGADLSQANTVPADWTPRTCLLQTRSTPVPT